MKILSYKEVVKRTGLSRVTIWRLEKSGKFPQRKQLSQRRVGWVESEINEWLEGRPRIEGGKPHERKK